MIRVLVVDDDPLVGDHLSSILGTADDIEVVGQAHDGAEAVERVMLEQPDVVLMDIRMPGVDGIAATARIAALQLPSRVIALTAFDDQISVQGAIRAGAAGFLLKSTPPQDLLALVRVAAAGHSVLSREILSRLTRPSASSLPTDTEIPALTPREIDVLDGLGHGRSNAQIAADLVLSETTVKGHVSRILDKLGCENRTQAGLLAHLFLTERS